MLFFIRLVIRSVILTRKKRVMPARLCFQNWNQKITKGLGFDISDTEGRFIQADFKDLSVASTMYLPSGSSGEERQARKLKFMDEFMKFMQGLKSKRREFIICADWNICQTRKLTSKIGEQTRKIQGSSQRSVAG